MITKHFFKILVIFTGMIILGVIGVSIINYFDQGKNTTASVNTDTNNNVAK